MMLRCLILALALLTSNAEADQRLLPYIDWLTSNSDLEYNGEPLPTVTQIPYGVLEIYAHGEKTVAAAERDGRTLAPVEAVYDFKTDEIIFADGADPWQEKPVLVHELVHYLQDINGTLHECSGENEMQAYKLHWQWTQEHDFDDEEPNWLYVFLLQMSCRDIHPYHADSPP